MGSLMKRGGVYFGKLRDLDGKIVRYSTGQRTPAKAGAILAEWERRVAGGLPALPDDDEKRAAAEARKRRDATKGLTVSKLCDLFRDEYKRPRIKSMRRYWQTYGAYLRYGVKESPIADLLAVAVRKADLEKWRDGYLAVHYSPATAKVVIGLLTTVYNWAINDREVLNVRNPCRGLEPLQATARAKVYDLAQMQRILKEPTAAPMLRAMVYTVAYGGLRHGELCGLRRTEDLFLDAPTPHLIVNRSYTTSPKGGKPRTIPLHPLLAEELRAYLKQAPPADQCGDLVFPCPIYNCRGRIRHYRMGSGKDMYGLIELLRAANVPIPTESERKGRAPHQDKRTPHQRAWHAMRHSFGTRCRDCGIPRDAISDLLGHAPGGAAVTSVYLHDSPETLGRLAVELARLWYVDPTAAPEKTPEAPPAPIQTTPETPGHEGAEIIDFAAIRAARARKAG